jgi:3-(methylthio)propionyl---CoA ligase
VFLAGEQLRVVDAAMADVPADATTVGEVVMRGNTVAAGYFEDSDATAEAFRGGWFHSGDLAVRHADGSIELRDRIKDIIVSGGENISSIEVEQVIVRHPAVLDAAVVPVAHPKWGERPHAWVEVREDQAVTADELRALCRRHLAGFKCPDGFTFGPLPRTGTGKVQKFQLRRRVARA